MKEEIVPVVKPELITTTNEILHRVAIIQDVMKKVMQEGEHFGVIPGTGSKKTLFKAGAEKLSQVFKLLPRFEVKESTYLNDHKDFEVTCILHHLDGSFQGEGVGSCSTKESKYRWRKGERTCPECSAPAIIKGKKEYGGGWLCFGKKGGCGSKWPDGASEIESQNVDRVENEDIADTYNTVLKMAKKRAHIDAIITATAASDIFTQDVGDIQEPIAPPIKQAPSAEMKKALEDQRRKERDHILGAFKTEPAPPIEPPESTKPQSPEFYDAIKKEAPNAFKKPEVEEPSPSWAKALGQHKLDFMQYCEGQKDRIGDTKYYEILELYSLEKSIYVHPDDKDRMRAVMSKLKKEKGV